MLVYEPGQFFATHQDAEKDDAMVGTLVVTLPSAHTGGELVIEDRGETMEYRGSAVAVSLVAFYSDCRHQVLPVKTGNRITLTYNLLPKGDTGAAAESSMTGELAARLDEHFSTPRISRNGSPAYRPCARRCWPKGMLAPRPPSTSWASRGTSSPAGCGCDLCGTLARFLQTPSGVPSSGHS